MVCYGVDKGYRDMWNEYWHVSTRNRGSGIGGAFPMNLGDDVRCELECSKRWDFWFSKRHHGTRFLMQIHDRAFDTYTVWSKNRFWKD